MFSYLERGSLMMVYGDFVLPMGERRIIRNGAVIVENGEIVFVGKEDEARKFMPEERIGGKGKVVMPGFVNAHNHLFQAVLRNLAVDMTLLDWLRTSIWPMLSLFNSDEMKKAVRLGILEAIKSGTTTLIDNHYGGRFYDEVADELILSGIRGVLARGGYEINAREELLEDRERIIADTERLIKKYSGRLVIAVAPMHPCFASKELLLMAKDLSERYNVPYHTHTSESREDQELVKKVHGKTDVELLYELGILGPRYHAVHGVWMSENEIKLMAISRANLVHNPISNMYLGSKAAPVPEMMREGVNIALGTDGPASNNNQDMMTSMKVAALLHKSSKQSPTAISSWDVLEMATLNGAKALNGNFGALKEGKRADIVVMDFRQPNTSPLHDPVGTVVYCATYNNVDSVIVDGRVLMKEKKMLVYEEEKVIEEAERAAYSLLDRVKSRYGIKFRFEELME
jgi:5-methylthioadenosine/S-adenosylhomocysteine deaminase